MGRTKEEQELLDQLGKAIRYRRKQQGLSQEIFARKADLQRSYFAMIERGKQNLSVLNLTKIADGLGVTVADLLEWEEE